MCREEERELHQALDELDAEASTTTAELSSRREEDLADALGRVQGLVERARGLSGLLRERGRSVAAALDAAADVDVVSTLESEAARLDAEMAAADAEADESGGGERAGLEAALAALDAEAAQLAARWEAVLDGDRPDQAAARARARTELVARAAAREQQDVDSLAARLASTEERNAAAAVRADLQAGRGRRARDGDSRVRGRPRRRDHRARAGRRSRRIGPARRGRGRAGPPPHGGTGRGARARPGRDERGGRA